MPLGPTTELGAALPSERTILVVDVETCVCGHLREVHEHYRPGSDCALCDCPKFRKKR